MKLPKKIFSRRTRLVSQRGKHRSTLGLARPAEDLTEEALAALRSLVPPLLCFAKRSCGGSEVRECRRAAPAGGDEPPVPQTSSSAGHRALSACVTPLEKTFLSPLFKLAHNVSERGDLDDFVVVCLDRSSNFFRYLLSSCILRLSS